MAEVVFRDVYKYFDDTPVVDNFNFQVNDKEFVVIVGPSGCGKSTTLRMVAGLESITSGDILIGDRVVNDVSPKNRDIAMVFQNYALYPHMDVYRNMAFGLKLQKIPQEEIDRRVARAADILGIESLLQRKPKQLSGGQRQRVALGRAIVREPSVFLFDEPLSNLDAKLRVQMRAEIKKLHDRLKTTMMYVTHDQVEAMTMGDRIVILKDGILQQAGTPMDVYRYPANVFVAGFIGSPSMNMIDAERVNGKLLAGDTAIPTEGFIEKTFNLDTISRCVIGVRPEDFFITTSDNGEVVSIDTTVELIETTGAEVLIHCKINSMPMVVRVTPDIKIPDTKTIKLGFNSPRMHLFDSTTQVTLRRQ
jgi:multiple sugar transport system ATP-binding protein